jgi:hypothetical protein
MWKIDSVDSLRANEQKVRRSFLSDNLSCQQVDELIEMLYRNFQKIEDGNKRKRKRKATAASTLSE